MNMESPSARLGDSLDAFVGERVRSLRHQRGVSLQVVAERSDLSVGFLSQIERGLSSPTLRDLVRIATALDTDLGFFFDADGLRESTQDSIVVRPAQRQAVAFHAGVVKHRLTPPGDSPLVLYMVTIEPHGRTGEALYTHRGEEAGLVLQGRLLLTVENTDHLLSEGDSFRFRSDRPHRFSNPAGTVTRVVWVNVTQPETRD